MVASFPPIPLSISPEKPQISQIPDPLQMIENLLLHTIISRDLMQKII
jgi:hypothetical protein